MISAARKAGRSLVRDFGEVEQLQVSIKGPANFVSAADHKAEDIIFKELSKARVGYGFLMEERGEVDRRRQDASLDRRSARRHDQLPAFQSAVCRLDRTGARRPARRRRHLQSRERRTVHRREGQGRLHERSAPARRGAQERLPTPWSRPASRTAAAKATRAFSRRSNC